MTDILGNRTIAVDDNPQWDSSIFHTGNLPPNTLTFDDMDLGTEPFRPVEDPVATVEGYWDRDDINGYVYLSQLSDIVTIGSVASYYDEKLSVTGKIYTTSGIAWGDGDTLLYESTDDVLVLRVGDENGIEFRPHSIRGKNDVAPFMIENDNSPSATHPTYTWYGDSDTGIFRVEADSLGIAAGGNAVVKFSSSDMYILQPPTADPTDDKDALVYDSGTGQIYTRGLGDLHAHSNKDVLDLLSDIGGELGYDGVLVADFTDYATITYVDSQDAALQDNIDQKADINHNHNLADLAEKNYNSLTNKPDLSGYANIGTNTSQSRLAIWEDGSTIGGDSNLTWSASNLYVNGRIGINETNPSYPIHINQPSDGEGIRIYAFDDVSASYLNISHTGFLWQLYGAGALRELQLNFSNIYFTGGFWAPEIVLGYTGDAKVTTHGIDENLQLDPRGAGIVLVDELAELTSGAGVTIENLILKDSFIDFPEITDPGNPDADKGRLFAEDDTYGAENDTVLKYKDENGNKFRLTHKRFVHVQGTASNSWVINHNLGKEPEVQLYDDNTPPNMLLGPITHNSVNQTTISLPINVSGKAICII